MVDYVGFAGWSSRLGAMAYPLWTKRSTAWKHMKAARWTQGWCLPSVFMGDHLTRRNMQSETVQLTSLGIWNVSLEACQRLSSGQNFTAWLLMLGEKLWQPSLICLCETETENSVLQGPSILENAVFYRTASSEVGVGRPVLSREPPGETSQLTCCLISARGSYSSDLNCLLHWRYSLDNVGQLWTQTVQWQQDKTQSSCNWTKDGKVLCRSRSSSYAASIPRGVRPGTWHT